MPIRRVHAQRLVVRGDKHVTRRHALQHSEKDFGEVLDVRQRQPVGSVALDRIVFALRAVLREAMWRDDDR